MDNVNDILPDLKQNLVDRGYEVDEAFVENDTIRLSGSPLVEQIQLPTDLVVNLQEAHNMSDEDVLEKITEAIDNILEVGKQY